MTLLRFTLLLLCIFSGLAKWQAEDSYPLQLLLYRYSLLSTRRMNSMRGTLNAQKFTFVDDLNKCVFMNKENNLYDILADYSLNRVCGMFVSSHFHHQLKPFVLMLSPMYASHIKLNINKLETVWTGKFCPMHGVDIRFSGNNMIGKYCGVYLPISLMSNEGGFQITAYGYTAAFTLFKFEFFYHILSTGHGPERQMDNIIHDVTRVVMGVMDIVRDSLKYSKTFFQARPYDQMMFDVKTNGKILAHDFNVHDGPGPISRKLIAHPLKSTSIQVYTSSFMAYFTITERHYGYNVTFHIYSIFDRLFARIPSNINIGGYPPCFKYISMHTVSVDTVNVPLSQNSNNTACYYIYKGFSTNTLYYRKYPVVRINHLLYKGATILQASTDNSCQYGGVFIFGMDPVKSQVDSLAMLCSDTDAIRGHSVPSPHTDLMIVVVGFGSYSQVSLKALVSSSQCRSQYVHCNDNRPTMSLITRNSDHCQVLVVERNEIKVTKERTCFAVLQPFSDLMIGPARITITSEKRLTDEGNTNVKCEVNPFLLVVQMNKDNFTVEQEISKTRVNSSIAFNKTYRFLIQISLRYHTCILNDKAIYVHIQKALCVSRSSYDTGFILLTKLFGAKCEQSQRINVNMVNSNDTYTFIMASNQPQDMREIFVVNHENCHAKCEEFELKLTEVNLGTNHRFIQTTMSRIGIFVEIETKTISHLKILQVNRQHIHGKLCKNSLKKCKLVITTSAVRNLLTLESVRNTNKTWHVIFNEGGWVAVSLNYKKSINCIGCKYLLPYLVVKID